eukprot:3227344-Rhodomonas_salina.1
MLLPGPSARNCDQVISPRAFPYCSPGCAMLYCLRVSCSSDVAYGRASSSRGVRVWWCQQQQGHGVWWGSNTVVTRGMVGQQQPRRHDYTLSLIHI